MFVNKFLDSTFLLQIGQFMIKLFVYNLFSRKEKLIWVNK